MNNCSKERILVTGGAGYIGSVLVPELLKAGYKVTVLDNFMFRQNSLIHLCFNPDFSVIRGDCRNASIMKPLLAKADYILPLAALVGAPICERDTIAAITTNTEAIRTIIEFTSKQQRIIFPMTNSGYGIGKEGVYCTEDMPLQPISLYGKTKVEAEKIIMDRGNAVSLRLATVFGPSPRMRIDLLVNNFTYRAINDKFVVVFEGHYRRNYIHILDVAKAFLFVINNFDRMKDQAYNVGLSDANLSKLELCAKIKEQLPDFVYFESQIGEDPDKRNYIVSNEKIERCGFKPSCSLEQGIQELIKVYTMISNSSYGNI